MRGQVRLCGRRATCCVVLAGRRIRGEASSPPFLAHQIRTFSGLWSWQAAASAERRALLHFWRIRYGRFRACCSFGSPRSQGGDVEATSKRAGRVSACNAQLRVFGVAPAWAHRLRGSLGKARRNCGLGCSTSTLRGVASCIERVLHWRRERFCAGSSVADMQIITFPFHTVGQTNSPLRMVQTVNAVPSQLISR